MRLGYAILILALSLYFFRNSPGNSERDFIQPPVTPQNRSMIHQIWSSNGWALDVMKGQCSYRETQYTVDGRRQHAFTMYVMQEPTSFNFDYGQYLTPSQDNVHQKLLFEVDQDNMRASRPVLLMKSNYSARTDIFETALVYNNSRFTHMAKLGFYNNASKQFAIPLIPRTPEALDKLLHGETAPRIQARFGGGRKNMTITRLDDTAVAAYNALGRPGGKAVAAYSVAGFNFRSISGVFNECALRRISSGFAGGDSPSTYYLNPTTYNDNFQYCRTGDNVANGDPGKWGPFVDPNPNQPRSPSDSSQKCPFYCPDSSDDTNLNQTIFYSKQWSSKSCVIALGYDATNPNLGDDCYGEVSSNQKGFGQKYPVPVRRWKDLSGDQVKAFDCALGCSAIGRAYSQTEIGSNGDQANKCFDSGSRRYANCFCGPNVNDVMTLEVAVSKHVKVGLAKTTEDILIRTSNRPNRTLVTLCYGEGATIIQNDCIAPMHSKIIVRCSPGSKLTLRAGEKSLVRSCTPGAGPSGPATSRIFDEYSALDSEDLSTIDEGVQELLAEAEAADLSAMDTTMAAAAGSYSESVGTASGLFDEAAIQAGMLQPVFQPEAIAAIESTAATSATAAADTGAATLTAPLLQAGVTLPVEEATAGAVCWGVSATTLAVGGVVVVAVAVTVGLLIAFGVIPIPDTGCHPNRALVMCGRRADGSDARTKTIDSVQLGDQCLSGFPNVFSRVFFFSHNETGASGTSVSLQLGKDTAVEATQDHYIVANGETMTFGDVRVGDLIMTASGEQPVQKVAILPTVGLVHPMTEDGNLVVNGVQTRAMSGWGLEKLGFKPSAFIANLYQSLMLPVMLMYQIDPNKIARFLQDNPSIANMSLPSVAYKLLSI